MNFVDTKCVLRSLGICHIWFNIHFLDTVWSQCTQCEKLVKILVAKEDRDDAMHFRVGDKTWKMVQSPFVWDWEMSDVELDIAAMSKCMTGLAGLQKWSTSLLLHWTCMCKKSKLHLHILEATWHLKGLLWAVSRSKWATKINLALHRQRIKSVIYEFGVNSVSALSEAGARPTAEKLLYVQRRGAYATTRTHNKCKTNSEGKGELNNVMKRLSLSCTIRTVYITGSISGVVSIPVPPSVCVTRCSWNSKIAEVRDRNGWKHRQAPNLSRNFSRISQNKKSLAGEKSLSSSFQRGMFASFQLR